jgi:hypothetical protein
MNRIRAISRLTAILTGLATALLAATTIPALAQVNPPEVGTPAPAAQLPVHTIVAGGMPGWQIGLIAIAAAVTAAVTAVYLDRARAARQPVAAPNA